LWVAPRRFSAVRPLDVGERNAGDETGRPREAVERERL
jgi:hypothetical protein